jgi:flagellar FliL protein
MAEDQGEEAEAEGGPQAEGDSEKKGSKKKLFILIGLVVLLGLGGVTAAFFTGLMQPLIDLVLGQAAETTAEAPQKQEVKAPETVVFYELPELLVNLNTGGGRRASFLKLRVSLELERAEEIATIEKVMPRIIDNFQVYLRELRMEDLKGSAGVYRLREELLTRVSAASPAKVRDVLFKEMLVQ